MNGIPGKFIEWAGHIHPDVESYIRKVLDNKSYPEQTYRSCVGILSFEKKAGKDRLIAACQRASSFGVYNYKVIGQIIGNRLDRVKLKKNKSQCHFMRIYEVQTITNNQLKL